MGYSASLTSLGELGLGADEPPAGFVFPDEATYLQGLVSATSAMVPTVKAKPGSILDTVPPPVKVQISGLQMALEGATGMPLSNLSQVALSTFDLAQAVNAVQVASAVSSLLDGTLKVATDVAAAVGAASDVVATIPVLGQFVSMAAGAILGALSAAEAYADAGQKCQDRVDGKVNAMCSSLVSQAQGLPTSPQGASPSDLFRPLAYRWQSNSHLPLSPASIYVALCADEVQQWPRVSTNFVQRLKSLGTFQGNHIPKDVRRQMWRLCRSLMTSIRAPTLGLGIWYPSDHGRSAFPILQSIVLTQIERGSITESYLQQMGDAIAGVYRISEDCPDLSPKGPYAGAMPHGGGDCRSRVDLFAAFKEGLLPYQASLNDCFRNADGSWRTAPKPGGECQGPGGPVLGQLTINSQLANQLVANEQSILSALREDYYPAFGQLKLWQKALLAAGTVGAGYLGYEAVRKLT